MLSNRELVKAAIRHLEIREKALKALATGSPSSNWQSQLNSVRIQIKELRKVR